MHSQQRQAINGLVTKAVQTLEEILNDPKASPSVRLRAALAVLKFAAMPETSGLEETVDPTEPVPNALRPQLVQPRKIENDAQSCTIATVRLPAGPARNTTCPCGSGQKFKRCCSQKASGQ